MQSVTMSTKGQIIIPADIRKKYGLKKGEKLIIEDEDGYIKMIPRTTGIVENVKHILTDDEHFDATKGLIATFAARNRA